MNNKVVIIGCGNVGMSYAYALLNQNTYVNKLILIDLNKEKTTDKKDSFDENVLAIKNELDRIDREIRTEN